MSSSCRHHWVIDAATGPASKGRCKFCRAEQTFENYMPMMTFRKHVPLQKAQRPSAAYEAGLAPLFGMRATT